MVPSRDGQIDETPYHSKGGIIAFWTIRLRLFYFGPFEGNGPAAPTADGTLPCGDIHLRNTAALKGLFLGGSHRFRLQDQMVIAGPANKSSQ